MSRARDKEFGDFQTPPELAAAVVRTIGGCYSAIVEPTCGQGAFLAAAARYYPESTALYGFDISRTHLRTAAENIPRAIFAHADFFSHDWSNYLAGLTPPVLILGNPPWVTSAEQGKSGGINLPQKENAEALRGHDARTGKSNFDVSEWMLRRLLDAAIAAGRATTIAVLIKTAVARKILAHAWKNKLPLSRSAIYSIDAAKYFDVSVSACLFTTTLEPGAPGAEPAAQVYTALDAPQPSARLGFNGRYLLSDLDAYERGRHLEAVHPEKWRSGVKHDAAAIMELTMRGQLYYNGLGEPADVDPQRVYPLLKATDLAKHIRRREQRYLLVPRESVNTGGEELDPTTRAYLEKYGAELDRRKSSIYKKRPRFSIFGVGPYTFTPWKIAISGLHKSIDFRLIGPIDGRPVVFDDTCYFLPCASREEAEEKLKQLCAPEAQAFLNSQIFWDAKRPVTAELLGRLDLKAKV